MDDLLSSSITFKEPNLLDHIHQWIIDLENMPKDQIRKVLNFSLAYLDTEIDLQISNDIFSLILSCFLYEPTQPDSFFNELIEHSQLNSNRIIITAAILYYLRRLNPELMSSITAAQPFIQNSLTQILNQIKTAEDADLIIFDKKIPHQFQANFIINIVLLSKLNNEIITQLYPYIFSHKSIQNNQLKQLISKISHANLLSIFPDTILTNDYIFSFFSMKSLANFIPSMSEQTFNKILPLIYKKYAQNNDWDRQFILSIIPKLVTFKTNFKLIENILNSLSPSDMKPIFWKYFASINATIPEKLASKITKFPMPSFALKIVPHPENLPEDVIKHGLLESPDFLTYKKALLYDTIRKNEVISTTKFWNHLVSIASKIEKEEEEKYRKEMMKQLSTLLMQHVPKERVSEVFSSMIFSHFPTTNKGNIFMYELLIGLDSNYKNSFNESSQTIFEKVIEADDLPLPSFWSLFNFNCMKDFADIQNPIALFAYEFSNARFSGNQLGKVTILPLEDHNSSNLLSKFIKHKDTDYIVNMNNEALSLIASSFIFTTNNKKPEVLGLTKEIVLPFLAVAFNYLNKSENNLLFDSPEISSMLLDACKSITSKLSRNSIDAILSNSVCFTDPKIFPAATAGKIINNLLQQLIRDSYPADIGTLLAFIFDISCQNPKNELIEKFFNTYRINILKLAIKNFESFDFEKFKNSKLDLSIFDAEQISKHISTIIQDARSSSYILNAISLLKKQCINAPKITLDNSSNLVRVLHETINRQKWRDVLLIAQVMKENGFEKELRQFKQIPLPSKIKDDLYSIVTFVSNEIDAILSDPQPETKTELLQQLFNVLMKDKSIATDYFTILYEKISNKRTLTPSNILEKYMNEYEKYGDDFVNILRKFFCFHPTQKIFVRNTDFQSITLPLSKTGLLMKSRLYHEASKKSRSYKSFFCLKSIASSFPFLFTEDPLKLFELVLPSLDYFSLYFTIENETETESIDNLKIALSALSFLHSTLYSVKVLSAFVPWIFKNITSFSTSQIIAFTFIINSLFQSKRVKKVLFAISLRYRFLEIISQLLQKEVQEELQEIYKKNIFNIILLYFKYFDRLNGMKSMYINEISILDDPFNSVFDNFSTVYPKGLQSLDIPASNIKEISDFMKSINEKRSFWLEYSYTKYPSSDQKNKFLDDFNRLETNIPSVEDLPELPSNYISNNLKTIQYLATHHYYIYQWFIRYKTYPMLLDQATTMTNAYNEIDEINKSDGPNPSSYSIDTYEYLPHDGREQLLNDLVNESMIVNDNLMDPLCSTIKTITKCDPFLRSVLQIIKNCLSEKRNDENSLHIVKRLTNILSSTTENSTFKSIFVESCGNILLDIVNSPVFREDASLLGQFSDMLYIINKDLPIRAVHTIGFMMILNQQKILPQALKLCEKFTDEQLNCILNEINKVFRHEFNNKESNYLILNLFFERFPQIAKKKASKILSMLKNLVEEFKSSSSPSKDLQNLICSAFTVCAPERIKDQIIVASESNEIDFTNSVAMTVNPLKKTTLEAPTTLIKQAPINLIKTNEKFWDLFEESRPILNDILIKDEKMLNNLKFLTEFPELLRFYTRSRYFRKKMKDRIVSKGSFSIYIDRSNLLESTFNVMKNKSIDDWLSPVSVNFNGEAGIDVGGLTCEWFTLIVKELLDPKNSLFRQLENKSCQPNPSSRDKKDFVEYFRFAGRIIARALIQGQCVNAHLTRSFCRQILHKQVKLKDLEDYDQSIFNSMNMILDNDVDDLDMVFTVSTVENGEYKEIELKEDGENLPVTNENKQEYVSLFTNYHLRKSVLEQTCAFCEGFDSLIPHDDIRIFSPGELDLLICGLPTIDLNDLMKNVTYQGAYSKDHPVIQMFFDVLAGWDAENLAKLLLFITGSSQVPVNGFKDYRDKGKPIRINSVKGKDRLCVAHTCFNTLDLPQYENEDEMEEKLLLSIQETEFGLG